MITFKKMINNEDRKRYFFGILVVLIGIFLFIKQLGIFPTLGNNLWALFTKFWPLLLLFLGVKLYISDKGISHRLFFLKIRI